MRRELGFARRSIHRRQLVALMLWALPEALPTAVSGVVVAHALDDGFLTGDFTVGMAWLGSYLVAAGVGAVGSGQMYRRLGGLVEPFRDSLVRKVVGDSLRRGADGHHDDGAVARLTRHVESIRDAYAGLLVIMLGFAATMLGVVIGLMALAPALAALIAGPFVLGTVLFIATLGVAAARERASIHADDRLATVLGTIYSGRRDVVAIGGEARAMQMAEAPIREQAGTERALAKVAALRSLCFAVGGWLPLLVLLFSGPWLVDRGLTAGAIMGALTYVLFGLQPALRTLISGLGSSGLRFVVTLGGILDAAPPASGTSRCLSTPDRYDLSVNCLSFAYGPHAEPVLDDLHLTVPEGEHLAIVGPSGIGKSTLANLLCGMLPPTSGLILVGGTPVRAMPPQQLAQARVLIPQEAYVFSATVWENLTYLNTQAAPDQVDDAVMSVGAERLVANLGGYSSLIAPADLSAGERQQLALVRAYLSPAPIVVLDEATCHLDPAAERQAEDAFANRPGTLIVIAHRVSSALRAHRVLVLDGSTAAWGDHGSLLASSPLYQELVSHWITPADDTPSSPVPEPDRLRFVPRPPPRSTALNGRNL